MIEGVDLSRSEAIYYWIVCFVGDTRITAVHIQAQSAISGNIAHCNINRCT
jgi:hypothetical protein